MTGTPGTPSLSRVALAGVPATLAMDVGARAILAPALGVEAPGPRELGRWVGHMRHGRFRHPDIATAPAVAREAVIGSLTHYAIGLTLGAGYGLLLRAGRARRSSIPLALAYGTATTGFSWLLMFPATGKGLLGRRANPKLAALSLGNHLVFGLALGAAIARSAASTET